MNTTRQVQCEAIILARRPYRDADRIVELLTAERGRISAVARSARVSRRRFQGRLELFATIRTELTARGSWWQMNWADVLDVRLGLRDSLARIDHATVLVECARALTAEDDAAVEAYAAVNQGLDLLARGDYLGSTQHFLRLVRTAGIFPDVSRCSRCGGPSPNRVSDDAHQMLLCAGCGKGLPMLTNHALAVFAGARCPDDMVANEVITTCVVWTQGHLGRALVIPSRFSQPVDHRPC